MIGFDRGDYFLLEVALHDLPLPVTEHAIRQADPALRGGLFGEEFDPRSIEFFAGPLLRNRRGVRDVTVTRTVQCPSVVPNSYAVGPVVTAHDNDGKQAEFRFAKANRYHLDSLIATVEREGFKLIKHWRYGERLPCAVILFEMQGRK